MKRALALSSVATAVLCAGCGTTRKSEPIAGPMTALASEDVRTGRVVFMQHCHACHVHGEGGLGPPLNDKPLPAFAVRFQVRHGFGAMPAFSEKEIDDRKLDDLVAYVRALREHEGGPRSNG